MCVWREAAGCFKRGCNERGCLQMQTHANKRAQTQTNADKRRQTQSSLKFGFGKRGLLEKGSFFQRSPFSRDSRQFRDSRDSRDSTDSREPPDCRKQRRIRPFPRDSRELRDFRDSGASSSEKTPFVMTPFSGPEKWVSKLRPTRPNASKRRKSFTPFYAYPFVAARPWSAWGGSTQGVAILLHVCSSPNLLFRAAKRAFSALRLWSWEPVNFPENQKVSKTLKSD